jgi:predicted outer membrane lipoprotein
MSTPAVMQLVAVIVGGLLATAGAILTNLYIERMRQTRESRNLALAFKGEITALLQHIKERHYQQRFAQVIEEIQQTQQPFLMPFRIRFRYDRVYDENVERIGLLNEPLPELIPLFYTRLTSVLEDMLSLGDETYAGLELELLLRIYRDMHRVLGETVDLGNQILETIDSRYKLK